MNTRKFQLNLNLEPKHQNPMINKKILQNEFIARLSILSDKNFIHQAQEFVKFYARYFNFSGPDVQTIELITEEALLSTIQNTFDEDEPGWIDVKIMYRPGKFIISIEDQGIPVDFRQLEQSEYSALGILLMKHLADEFHFVNLGKGGKKLELVKYHSEEKISEVLTQGGQEAAEAGPPILATDTTSIRLVLPDDAEMLARLAYRVYGYSYFSFFYFPDKIRELIANGLLASAVAVNSRNEIVGNLSLFFQTAGARVADSGAAMVDPRYRGHSLFKNMKLFLKDYAAQKLMYGLYSEAVTIHTFTQQGNMSLGAKETGIMLAYIKERLTFKKINDDRPQEQRQAAVLYYLKTSREPFRKVYICERFFPILKKVYDHLELDREVIEVNKMLKFPADEVNSLVSSVFKPDLNVAFISFACIGLDAFEVVKRQLKEFCLNKVETIYVEMPVDTPVSAILSDRLTDLGFLLSGVVPEYQEVGDYLKLQYLNNVRIDQAKINIASDLGKELLAEIMKAYASSMG